MRNSRCAGAQNLGRIYLPHSKRRRQPDLHCFTTQICLSGEDRVGPDASLGQSVRSRSCRKRYTGVAVFRAGLKKGSFTTRAPTLFRTASTVISISSLVPGAAWLLPTLASAIIFFSVGDQVV